MAINNTDRLEWLRKHLEASEADLRREMIRSFAEQLMSAQAQGPCGAGYGEASPERVNLRNGYRAGEVDGGPLGRFPDEDRLRHAVEAALERHPRARCRLVRRPDGSAATSGSGARGST